MQRLRLTRLALPFALLVACGTSEPPSRFNLQESLEQLYVTRATPGETLGLIDAAGKPVQMGKADAQGSLVFRKVPPGEGYRVQALDAPTRDISRKLTVRPLAGSTPAADFYARQKLKPGYQYITVRDGTTLSAYITLPGPLEKGPYPTVVDYSGYDPSKPGQPIGKFEFLCEGFPALCDAPNDPSALNAALAGYATVSVNLRGTGCSGGAYDYFEALQLSDGYDVIETVAAQDFVLHHKVGMIGLSYPGIAQLFVASTRPPSLAAITPLSVIGNTATTLVPGGILNDGFAINWVRQVLDRADPYGQGWERKRVDGGDTICGENQRLHSQKVNNVQQAYDTQFYVPEVVDPLNPSKWVDQIEVPVFLAGAWQDEQTGPFFASLMDKFTRAPARRFTVYNGVHPDGFAPQVIVEWKAFLDLYVARRVPSVDKGLRDIAPVLFDAFYGAPLRFPPDRFANAASWQEAKAKFEAEPPLRVIFESGAGDKNNLGAPVGSFEKSFSAWPPKEATARRLYLHSDGVMRESKPPQTEGAASFLFDPEAGQRGILAQGGEIWDKLPKYDWRQPAAGRAVVFESEPLAADQTMVGTGSVDLFLKSTADDADLQVTLSELRPDGQEMYVQSGWLRASHRKLGPTSTELGPEPTHLAPDAKPLLPGEWTEARVGIAPFAHVFRARSKIRLVIDTPGATRAEWRFKLKPLPGMAAHTIGLSMVRPSSLALPLIGGGGGFVVPTTLPPCPSLRGQQCRTTQPYVNTPAK